ncbi:hypothetical protein P7K49_024738 [Saguinus oedipus]|uniref:Uncharacterized protein n=1 Tax=Saguinus oedipus TaxID=9490 RepID=A0ABQ9UQC6_SAGOE|nr:hypothetical protein P7K49_024738 [Saguinus oedipus]
MNAKLPGRVGRGGGLGPYQAPRKVGQIRMKHGDGPPPLTLQDSTPVSPREAGAPESRYPGSSRGDQAFQALRGEFSGLPASPADDTGFLCCWSSGSIDTRRPWKAPPRRLFSVEAHMVGAQRQLRSFSGYQHGTEMSTGGAFQTPAPALEVDTCSQGLRRKAETRSTGSGAPGTRHPDHWALRCPPAWHESLSHPPCTEPECQPGTS